MNYRQCLLMLGLTAMASNAMEIPTAQQKPKPTNAITTCKPESVDEHILCALINNAEVYESCANIQSLARVNKELRKLINSPQTTQLLLESIAKKSGRALTKEDMLNAADRLRTKGAAQYLYENIQKLPQAEIKKEGLKIFSKEGTFFDLLPPDIYRLLCEYVKPEESASKIETIRACVKKNSYKSLHVCCSLIKQLSDTQACLIAAAILLDSPYTCGWLSCIHSITQTKTKLAVGSVLAQKAFNYFEKKEWTKALALINEVPNLIYHDITISEKSQTPRFKKGSMDSLLEYVQIESSDKNPEYYAFLKKLITIEPNIAVNENLSLLSSAILNDDLPFLKELLAIRVKNNLSDAWIDAEALSYASNKKDLSYLKLLLEAGLNPNSYNKYRMPLLTDNEEAFELLLAYGATLDFLDDPKIRKKISDNEKEICRQMFQKITIKKDQNNPTMKK